MRMGETPDHLQVKSGRGGSPLEGRNVDPARQSPAASTHRSIHRDAGCVLASLSFLLLSTHAARSAPNSSIPQRLTPWA
ncbi:hypothetical protein BO78DRAFT_142130 [Aspergillus sclerotiicarbonarius CBS 121057]|uniref:Uncharacterized protein n=1 Tax=Aspergillus sclerotiicarbonarius (strain CBS 121057 / IBT 28362) TaxID=1448318 RepID=A0A319EQ36_ASPSB|nr:hypothetical protein BO78DRAFT_142130 [Aspergillus sclerotiicarbonarius CBS 121057]